MMMQVSVTPPEYSEVDFVKDTDKIQNLRLSANRLMIMQNDLLIGIE